MKTIIFCAAMTLLLVATTEAGPARLNLEKDVEEIPTGPYGDNDDDFSIGTGFFSGLNEMVERMRQQMLHLLSAVPRIGFNTPEGGNTTSVTKVINGHKVVINETTYKSGDGDDATAILKVRVVDIHPASGSDSDELAPPEDSLRSVESLEHSNENEVSNSVRNFQQKRKVNSMEMLDSGLESFDYPDNMNDLETFNEFSNGIETFDDDIENGHRDLSNDIYINKIAAARGQLPHPDAEVFAVEGIPPPHDLSRDTYVNEIAAHQNWPINPDVEILAPFKPEFGPFAAANQRETVSRNRNAEIVAQYRPVRYQNAEHEPLEKEKLTNAEVEHFEQYTPWNNEISHANFHPRNFYKTKNS